MVAIGHLIVYGAGALDLSTIFGNAIGDTQFKQMCVIAAVALMVAIGVTCWAVEERVLVSNEHEGQQLNDGVLSMLKQIYNTTRHLPNRIQAICWIQFWSWIGKYFLPIPFVSSEFANATPGWFPFLFYSSTYVGEIYLRYDAPHRVSESTDTLGDIGRVGSMALIVFSIVTFIGSITLPWLVKAPEDDEKPGFTPRPPQSIAPIIRQVSGRKPSLLTAWTYSHLVFAGSMIFAPFVASLRSATVLIALCGM